MANERVLLIEDSLVYRELIVHHILEPHGYQALVTGDGQEGLRLALAERPDLIITDWELPGLTGIQILEALHASRLDIPIILMTLHGSEELVVRAFRQGIKDYVIKPFEVEEMLSVIDQALTETRLRRERDALMRKLVEVNQQLQAILTHTEDVVLVVDDDPQAHIILANKAAQQAFGIEPNVAGDPLASIIDDEVLLDVFTRAQETARSAQAEITLSDERTLNANVTPIAGVGQVAVMQDITHFKELDRIKSELVSTVSHDLRSPLTSIKGFAELLPMAGSLNEQQKHFLSNIRRGVDSVADMIADLLDLGRIEAEARMEMTECDLVEIVKRTVIGLQGPAEYKHQSLTLRCDADLPAVLGNRIRLGQAISNLVGNAIKYTPQEGHIEVSVGRQNGHLAIAVKDDGMGIPADAVPRLFEKFYRVKSAETDNITGSGLGLSLVKSIVEKHQGRIWVDSQLGQGSIFTVVLPVNRS
ncbi:MAG: response regulator [Anaerolineae bacterium]|nr:response regulator [Anaerolineae bacterium]